jgi:hypothetical protein
MTTSATVTAQFPAPNQVFYAQDGTKYVVGNDGTCIMRADHYATAISAGAIGIMVSGSTAARPATAGTGFEYFDTTLGKSVWRKNATTWVDATSTTV